VDDFFDEPTGIVTVPTATDTFLLLLLPPPPTTILGDGVPDPDTPEIPVELERWMNLEMPPGGVEGIDDDPVR
jgi:hypothetical protein